MAELSECLPQGISGAPTPRAGAFDDSTCQNITEPTPVHLELEAAELSACQPTFAVASACLRLAVRSLAIYIDGIGLNENWLVVP